MPNNFQWIKRFQSMTKALSLCITWLEDTWTRQEPLTFAIKVKVIHRLCRSARLKIVIFVNRKNQRAGKFLVISGLLCVIAGVRMRWHLAAPLNLFCKNKLLYYTQDWVVNEYTFSWDTLARAKFHAMKWKRILFLSNSLKPLPFWSAI